MKSTGKFNLLIAEDSQAEITLLEVAMERAGLDKLINLTVAYDGEEAIECITNTPKPFDIILLDLNMPRVKGKEVLQFIKQNFGAVAEQVIVLSNSNNRDDIKDCYSLGAGAFVQKPIFFTDLIKFCSCIKTCLETTGAFKAAYICDNYPVLK